MLMVSNLERRHRDAAGNAIKITLTGRRNDATALRILRDHADRFKLLEHRARYRTRANLVVVAANAAVTSTAVRLAESTHTHVAIHVKLARNGRRANVEPIGVIRRKLLVRGSLHGIDPRRDFHLFEA